jgi:DNA-binding MarR family transcriptional regulator
MVPELFPCYCATLRQAARALTSRYDAKLLPVGLRATQFALLQTLEVKRGARIRDLEELLTMDQTTLTRNLAILSRRRLIQVIKRPSAREKCWGVTKSGKDLLEIATPLWRKAQAEVRAQFGAQETSVLHGEAFRLAALLGADS